MISRQQSLESLKNSGVFDILIIGGGATGCGVALDAASRGLKVALIERGDFSSGTSSKSTKLIHGGVRYLELAVKQLDRGQLHLVREALHERGTLLKLAPHLSRELSLFTPLYKEFEKFYYRVGLKVYDWLAQDSTMRRSRALSAKEAKELFPMVRQENLKGGVLYSDGQFDDARMNVALAITAAEQGATLANYVRAQKLLKDGGTITGAEVQDEFTGEIFTVRAKAVINATGPYVDSIRQMDDPSAHPMLSVSSGIHIVLPQKFCPRDTGLLIPKTPDGRVLFLLPWLGHTVVGTTDNPAQVTDNPRSTEDEINYIIKHVSAYLAFPLSRADVLSTWSGLRPLVSNHHNTNTAKLSRDHVIEASPSGLITITGGKWTTYRKMALDTVNTAIEKNALTAKSPSRTDRIPLAGGENFNHDLARKIVSEHALPEDVARHLCRAYGSRAVAVAQIATPDLATRLIPSHPYIEAEVVYAARNEMALTVADVLCRRTRLAFVDAKAASMAFARVYELLAATLDWDQSRREAEEQRWKTLGFTS